MRSRALVVAGFGALALAVAAGGYLLVIQPQRHQARTLTTQIASARTQLASLRAGGEAPTLRAADLFRLARAMPADDDVAGVLLDLSRLARASKLKLVSVRPAPRVALPDGSAAVPLSVTVDGSWHGVSSFLRAARQQVALRGERLSVSGRLFDVDSLQVSTGQPPSEVDAVLALNAFDYGAPASPTATAGASTSATTTTTTTASGS